MLGFETKRDFFLTLVFLNRGSQVRVLLGAITKRSRIIMILGLFCFLSYTSNSPNLRQIATTSQSQLFFTIFRNFHKSDTFSLSTTFLKHSIFTEKPSVIVVPLGGGRFAMSRRIRNSRPIKHGKKWQIRWTDEIGKRRSEVYSSYEDAEFALMSRKLETEQIVRGLVLRPSKGRTFDELSQKWLAVRTSQKRSPKDDISIISAHLSPAFSKLELEEITSEKIALFSADLMAVKAPRTVRNIITLLGAMLNQAIDWGWLTKAPTIRRPRVRRFDCDYRWLRSVEERDRFLTTAKTHQWSVTYPMYATAIYTGMRAGELAGLQWDDIIFERRIITVQRSYSKPTKAGDVRYVPILDKLLPILKSWKLACKPNRLVFPNNNGRMWDQSGRIYREVLHNVLNGGEFPPKYITFHSLRHTFASHWVMNGGDLYALQAILGHKDPKMTQRYAHLKPDAFQKYWQIMGPVKCQGSNSEGDVLDIRG